MVVVVDEPRGRPFELLRTVGALELDHVFHRAVIAFDFALGHRMIRRSTRVGDLVRLEIGGQFPREVAGAVVAQQPRPIRHTRTRSTPVFARARSSVSVTSEACIDVRTIQAMM